MCYTFALECLKAERNETMVKISKYDEKSNSKEKRELLRQMWKFDGAIEHGLCYESLNSITLKFARIDLVPQNYNYPELYQTNFYEEEKD